jgi:putative transposase
MSRSRHTEAEIIAALKQVEAGRKVEDMAREVSVSKHTIYAWKAKYGGMDVSEAQEVRQLREENARLKKLVADLSLAGGRPFAGQMVLRVPRLWAAAQRRYNSGAQTMSGASLTQATKGAPPAGGEAQDSGGDYAGGRLRAQSGRHRGHSREYDSGGWDGSGRYGALGR